MTNSTKLTWITLLSTLLLLAFVPACETGGGGDDDDDDGEPYPFDFDIWAEPESVDQGLEIPFQVSFKASFEGEVAPNVSAVVIPPSYLDGMEVVGEEGVELSIVDPGDAALGDPLIYDFVPALDETCSHDIEFWCRELGTGQSIEATFELSNYSDVKVVSVEVACTEAAGGGACVPASAAWEPDPYGEGYYYVTVRYDAEACSCAAEDGWQYGTTLSFRKTPGEPDIMISGLDIQILETSVGEIGVTGSGIINVPLGSEVTFTVYDENLDRTFTITATTDEEDGITVSSISDCS